MIKLSSFRHAYDGVIVTFKEHPNIRFHMLAGLTATLLSYLLNLNRLEFVIILFTISLVITSEMINTAIESMTDLITLEYRKEAKIAKDVAAGMVLINSLLAVIVAIIVFLPHLLIITSNQTP